MAIRNIRRQATNPLAAAGQTNFAPIYVDSDDNILKIIPAGSGTTEVQIVDASSAQTLTTKTLTSPTITGATISGTINSDYKVTAGTITYDANVTAAVITGFSWTVVPGTYVYEVNLPTTMTTVGGLTVSFKLTTAVLTSIQYDTYASTASDNTLAVSSQGTTTTDATKVFDSKTSAYTIVRIRGSMVVGTGGTFAWFGCQNTSATGGDVSIIKLGASAKLIRTL